MIKLQELAGMAKEISSKKWFLNADEEVTAIDNDALPDDTEEAFIGCAANIQLAKYMAAANPDTILAIAEAYSALEQRLKAAETEVQRLNATAQPVKLPTTRLWAGKVDCYSKEDVISMLKSSGLEVSE